MTANWPLAMTSEPGNGDSVARSSREPAAGREAGRGVAIVEDELMVAWSLESMIEDLGYEVTGIFPRGETALAEIDPEGTAIVLMDINLGAGLDGVETAQLLLQSQSYRILFISAYADSATQARVDAAIPGAQLLRKPLSIALLAEALAEGTGSRH